MKRTIVAIAVYSALAFSIHAVTPITAFQPGSYFAIGSYLADDGSLGETFSSVALSATGWKITQYRNGAFFFYQSNLTIDQYGFVTGTYTNDSNPNGPQTHAGIGYCNTDNCQFSADFPSGIFQKYIFFDATGNIAWGFGAVYNTDGTPSVQWEEQYHLIPASPSTGHCPAPEDDPRQQA